MQRHRLRRTVGAVRALLSEIVVDCHDPARLVRFWAGLLGGEPVDRSPEWSYVDPPEGVRVAFQRVPDPTPGKNRIHLDLEVPDLAEGSALAVTLGGRLSGGPVTDEQGTFQVVEDPEGMVFCLLA